MRSTMAAFRFSVPDKPFIIYLFLEPLRIQGNICNNITFEEPILTSSSLTQSCCRTQNPDTPGVRQNMVGHSWAEAGPDCAGWDTDKSVRLRKNDLSYLSRIEYVFCLFQEHNPAKSYVDRWTKTTMLEMHLIRLGSALYLQDENLLRPRLTSGPAFLFMFVYSMFRQGLSGNEFVAVQLEKEPQTTGGAAKSAAAGLCALRGIATCRFSKNVHYCPPGHEGLTTIAQMSSAKHKHFVF